jgi:deoxyguanosine kinase
MNLKHYRYIAIEGPIGAGKTSLAHNMAARLNCPVVLEQPETNPFLEKFYGDMPRYALSTQLFFLFQRMHQLETMEQENRFAQSVISDFLFEKDQLFADVTLNEPEYGLYQQIREHLHPRAPSPDLVIYLQATPEILIRRIRQRGNVLEQNLSEDYLKRLAERYLRFFHEYDRAPVMIVNSERLDFAHNTTDLDMLLTRIEQMRSAREYFNIGTN